MEDKKYYWLKLQKDFFKRHDVKIIEKMPNGKDYIIFYLKLLTESISHDGRLRFSDTIPYNEDMLAVITDTNVDVVRGAIKVFQSLHLMEIWDDQTVYMTETNKMLGVETEWAEKKRIYREKKKQGLLTTQDTFGTKKDNVRQEIEKELELEIDKDNNTNIVDKSSKVKVDYEELFEVFWKCYPKKASKGQALKTFTKLKPTKEDVDKWIKHLALMIGNNWYGKDIQYIPHASTWLNAKGYEDEIIRPSGFINNKNNTANEQVAETIKKNGNYL